MDITNHAKERYVERIKGINDKQEIKRYLATEDEKITDSILKLYDHSELVYRGQIDGDRTTKDFRVNQDLCLVIDGNCIRTIYRINFAFPESTRLRVIEDLKQEIKGLREEIKLEESNLVIEDNQIDAAINNLESEIKTLQVDIEIKKADIEKYQAIKKANRGTVRKLNTLVKNYAEQLLGNTHYKKDIV